MQLSRGHSIREALGAQQPGLLQQDIPEVSEVSDVWEAVLWCENGLGIVVVRHVSSFGTAELAAELAEELTEAETHVNERRMGRQRRFDWRKPITTRPAAVAVAMGYGEAAAAGAGRSAVVNGGARGD